MKRSTWIAIGVIVLLAAGWMLLMGYINTRITRLNVQVDGGVDRFSVYEAIPEDSSLTMHNAPLFAVDLKGQPGKHTIELRNTTGISYLRQMGPAQYFFVTEQGGKTYQSPPICCQTNFTNQSETVRIHAFDQWEKSDE